MTTYPVQRIDTSDEGALYAWWQVARAAGADRPWAPYPGWTATRGRYTVPVADTDYELYGVRAGGAGAGELAGALVLGLPTTDNLHLAEAEVYVDPQHRRTGLGRALVGAAEQRAGERGRTTVIAEVLSPVGGSSPGEHFATAMGYALGLDAEHKVVDLQTAPADWPALDEAVAERIGDYRVTTFERTPEQYAADFCALMSGFAGEIPTGELELEDAAWTTARLREREDFTAATGRRRFVTAAIAPDGRMVGFTDATVEVDEPLHAHVAGTLVHPGHRGHRLGLALKLANHRELIRTFGRIRSAGTGNATSNRHMNAVNEAMGYRVTDRSLDVQRKLGTER